MDPVTIGGGAGLVAVGGILVKIFDVIVRRREITTSAELTSRQQESLDANTLRDELWKELGVLRAEIKELHVEVDTWKTRYFDLLSDKKSLEARVLTMEAELDELRRNRSD